MIRFTQDLYIVHRQRAPRLACASQGLIGGPLSQLGPTLRQLSTILGFHGRSSWCCACTSPGCTSEISNLVSLCASSGGALASHQPSLQLLSRPWRKVGAGSTPARGHDMSDV